VPLFLKASIDRKPFIKSSHERAITGVDTKGHYFWVLRKQTHRTAFVLIMEDATR
jgi:hypothetical protein